MQKYIFLIDPFKKPDKILQVKVIDKQILKLEGIMWSETKPMAVINGEIVGKGQEIEGFKIEGIEKDRVRLSSGGSVLVLTLEGFNILKERR